MNHFATPDFWHCYHQLPTVVQELADKAFALLRQYPHHPSLRLKKVGLFWSARVGLRYRVLARHRAEGLVLDWFAPRIRPASRAVGVIVASRSARDWSNLALHEYQWELSADRIQAH